ncbi:MAG: hypothetical protein R2939_19245 [Kofleriaceae bacterium]
MERAARGTMPPFSMPPPDLNAASQATLMRAVARAATAPTTSPPACDLSTTCPSCGTEMRPEHAHYRCGRCGYRDSCCF